MKNNLKKAAALIIGSSLLLSGCGTQTTDISEEVDVSEVIEEASVTDEELALQELEQSPWLAYEHTDNINTDMENVSVWDVVNDMRIGWNLGNSLESTDTSIIRVEQPWKFETAWGNPTTKEDMIDMVLDAGFNVIRIPVTWTGHVDEDYNIVESWMNRIQTVVDYAYSKGAYVIINAHHETYNYPYYDNQEEACRIEKKIWAQIAERFKDYDEHLIFEGQNEPRKVGTALEWNGGDQEGWDVVNAVNAAFVEAVRNSGGSNPYRMLMLPTYGASNTEKAISAWTKPEGDDRIIASVHAYIPYNFCLDRTSSGRLLWNDDTADIDTMMSLLKTYFIDKDIPVILGEFGAMSRDSEERRIEWVTYYLESANAIGVPCFWWDDNVFNVNLGESLGLLNRNAREWEFPELLQTMMEVTAERAGDDAYIFNAEEYRAELAEKEAAEAQAAEEEQAATENQTNAEETDPETENGAAEGN